MLEQVAGLAVIIVVSALSFWGGLTCVMRVFFREKDGYMCNRNMESIRILTEYFVPLFKPVCDGMAKLIAKELKDN